MAAIHWLLHLRLSLGAVVCNESIKVSVLETAKEKNNKKKTNLLNGRTLNHRVQNTNDELAKNVGLWKYPYMLL